MAVILGWRRSFWVENDAKLWLWGCVFGCGDVRIYIFGSDHSI